MSEMFGVLRYKQAIFSYFNLHFYYVCLGLQIYLFENDWTVTASGGYYLLYVVQNCKPWLAPYLYVNDIVYELFTTRGV